MADKLIYAFGVDRSAPPAEQLAFSCLGALLNVVFIAFFLEFLRETFHKKRKIMMPLPNVPWEQTYCVLSLHMIYFIIGSLVLNIAFSLCQIVLFFMEGPRFDEIYENLFVVTSTISQCTNMACFIQAFEWYIMLFLIYYQKRRTVTQLYTEARLSDSMASTTSDRGRWTLENSQVGDKPRSTLRSTLKFEMSYRRQENLRKVLYWAIFWLLILMKISFQIERFVWPEKYRQAFVVYLYYHLASFLFELVTFVLLVVSLKSMHNYEYKRMRRSLFIQITISLFYHIMLSFNLAEQAYWQNWYDEWFTPEQQRQLRYSIIRISSLLKFISTVKVKSSVDVLQGVSKLDNLLKVSVFQLYKQDDSRMKRPFSSIMERSQEDDSLILKTTKSDLEKFGPAQVRLIEQYKLSQFMEEEAHSVKIRSKKLSCSDSGSGSSDE